MHGDVEGLFLVQVEGGGGTTPAQAVRGFYLHRKQNPELLKSHPVRLDDVRADHVRPGHAQRLGEVRIEDAGFPFDGREGERGSRGGAEGETSLLE